MAEDCPAEPRHDSMKYYTTAEVAGIIREKEENVARRCASGQLKAKRLGGKWLINEDDLTIFLEAPRTGSPRRRLTARQRQQLGEAS